MLALLNRTLLLALLLAGCGDVAPTPLTLTETSASGDVEARIWFDGPVRHGENVVLIDLEAREAEADMPTLTAVRAEMPAHGHLAHATQIVETDSEFRVMGLELFMTGRWLVELTIASGGRTESIAFPVDVP